MVVVVCGIIFVFFVVMFNFFVYKIDEGKIKYWEVLLVVVVMF